MENSDSHFDLKGLCTMHAHGIFKTYLHIFFLKKKEKDATDMDDSCHGHLGYVRVQTC